jgi:hypothetical protein
MAESYWRIVELISAEINIYEGPKVFLGTYSKVPPETALLYAAHFCQSEVCNGGFRQFFFNSTGVLAPEAVHGFRAIGQNRVAESVESAMLPFGSPYLRDRDARHSILDTMPPEAFDSLDEQFFELINTESGGFEAAADRYAAGLKL